MKGLAKDFAFFLFAFMTLNKKQNISNISVPNCQSLVLLWQCGALENLDNLNQEDDSDAKVEKANCIAFMGETKRADSHKEDAADKVEDGLQLDAIATTSDVVEEDTWEDDSIAN